MKRKWTELSPKEAVGISLPHPDIEGPLNEVGEECPWPWEPQQLVGVPMGQYHCGYCGGMQVAGTPHLDWRDFDEVPPDDEVPEPSVLDDPDAGWPPPGPERRTVETPKPNPEFL